jgi:hypothetical protein
MSRKVAVTWHALFVVAAGVLYFFFVLPRWPELTGSTSHTLGTVLRIATGILIGLAALPVVFTLVRTRKPELGTPQLALTLRTSSIGLHVLAGVLIVGTAISEIWLNLDNAGRWLFGIYGAAAAIALLGALAFSLSFVAELPPPPPKPLKPKAKKAGRRGRRKAADDADETDETTDVADADETTDTADADETTDTAGADDTADAEAEPAEADEQPAEVTAAEEPAGEPDSPARESTEDAPDETAEGGLRNRRTSGKISLRKRKRSRGGVAVDD